MGVKARVALIATAVCLAIAGGIVVWKPWGEAFPGGCAATTGMTGVRPGSVVVF